MSTGKNPEHISPRDLRETCGVPDAFRATRPDRGPCTYAHYHLGLHSWAVPRAAEAGLMPEPGSHLEIGRDPAGDTDWGPYITSALRRAHDGEHITITMHGRAYAEISPAEAGTMPEHNHLLTEPVREDCPGCAAERQGLIDFLNSLPPVGTGLTPKPRPGWAGPAVLVAAVADIMRVVRVVDAYLDSEAAPDYQAQPLAQDWARVTKPCEEAGEVWKAMSLFTGENPRKRDRTGKSKAELAADLLEELGDTASAALCAIQHLTKNESETWQVLIEALEKAWSRVPEEAR